MLAGFLLVPPVADVLGGRPSTLLGWAVAVTAIPAVLLADAAHKARIAGRRPGVHNRGGAAGSVVERLTGRRRRGIRRAAARAG
jgi:hypothetical protein